jgi:hypothetical protein
MRGLLRYLGLHLLLPFVLFGGMLIGLLFLAMVAALFDVSFSGPVLVLAMLAPGMIVWFGLIRRPKRWF